MAITAIDISFYEASNFIAVHNPLVYKAVATWNTSAPDAIWVDVYSNSVLVGTFRCIYDKDISASERQFSFFADEIFRAYMPDFKDIQQDLDSGDATLVKLDLSQDFTLTFKDVESGTPTYTDSVDAMCLNIARQFGQKPFITNYNENSGVREFKNIYSYDSIPFYSYIYNSTDGTNITAIDSEGDNVSLLNCDKGFYRYKGTGISDVGDRSLSWEFDSANIKVDTVINKDFCTEQKILKFLDRNGHFRFLAFSEIHEINSIPSLIGKTNILLSSIYNDQSNERNIGYNGKKTYSLTTDELPVTDYELFEDLINSPIVYLLINNVPANLNDGDQLEDWLIVDVQSKSSIIKPAKGSIVNIDIDVILPEYYTVKMI